MQFPFNRAKSILAVWSMVVSFGLMTFSCATSPSGAPEKEIVTQDENIGQIPPVAETRPDPENRDELEVVFSDSSLELDPRKSYEASEAQIFTGLYEGLFSYNPLTMEPVAAVASKWELSEDKKTWTFTIRSNARYWNGDPVLASHFRDAWLSLIDPKKNSPYSSLFDLIQGAKEYRLGKESDPNKIGISTPEDNKLVVTLVSPAAFFPSVLCHHSFAPVHPSMLKVEDWSKQSPISNGPFYIVERSDGKLIMARNELYWDLKYVKLKRITIRFTDDENEAAALWNSGEARWIAGNVDLEALRDRSGISLNAMFATHYYYIRSERAPWNDRRVRRALSISLPWDEIRKNYALPASTLIYPPSGYPHPDGISKTDLEEAKKLLSDAGFPNGVGLPELVIRITPSEEAARIAQLMAQTWHTELGVPIKIDTVSFDNYYQSLKKNDYVVGSTTWIGDFADPYTFLQMWQADSNLNDARYNDKEYESLMEKSMAQEGQERWKTLSEAEQILLEWGTVLPISYTPALNIIDYENEINGWFPNVLDIHPFKYLSFASFRPRPGVAALPGARRAF